MWVSFYWSKTITIITIILLLRSSGALNSPMDPAVLLQCYAELSEVLGSVVSHCSAASWPAKVWLFGDSGWRPQRRCAIFRCSVDSFATREAALAIDIVKERRKCGICVQMWQYWHCLPLGSPDQPLLGAPRSRCARAGDRSTPVGRCPRGRVVTSRTCHVYNSRYREGDGSFWQRYLLFTLVRRIG